MNTWKLFFTLMFIPLLLSCVIEPGVGNFAGEVKIGETAFTSTDIAKTSATALLNGRALFAYIRDSIGKFIIIDSNGSITKGETDFYNSGSLGFISTATLKNGNIVIAFVDGSSSKAYYTVVDSAGNFIKTYSAVTSSNVVTYYICAAPLSNGNAVITYSILPTGHANYVIINSSGSILYESTNTVINAAGSYFPSVTAVANNNALIAVINSGNKFYIYDADTNTGTTASTAFSANIVAYPRGTLVKTNVFLSYLKSSSPPYPLCYTVVDSSGAKISEAEICSICNQFEFYPTTLLNGNAIIFYADTVMDKGKYCIYDSTGNRVAGPAVFQSAAGTSALGAVTLATGEVLVAYNRNTTGCFMILK